MILGIDTGGTNVDAVLVDDGRVAAKAKVPNDRTRESVESVLAALRDDWSTTTVDRVVVSTTVVTNAAVQDRLPRCTNALMPGPGLSPERYDFAEELAVLPGCIDHRGRLTEELEFDGAVETPVVAATAKFAARNPRLELDFQEAVDLDDSHLALGSESGADLTFPERAATTVANAKTKPVFADYHADLAAALDASGIDAPVYDLKGDGAMLAEHTMRSTPAHTLRCGAAASTLGLLALTGVTDAVCVDIGGTTTDVARVTDGFPETDRTTTQGDIDPAYAGVTSESLPLGGDIRVERGPDGPALTNRREGNAAAFGGDAPTLTDALHVTGAFEGGDVSAARTALRPVADGDVETAARAVVDRYVEAVVPVIDDIAGPDVTHAILGGVLAPYLAERLVDRSTRLDAWTVPDHADVAGAVGCAAARVSVETSVHIDSERGVMTVSSLGSEYEEDVEEGRRFTDEEVERIAVDRARAAAEAAGGDPTAACEVLSADRFNVVNNRRIAGEIVDVRARVVPGLAAGFAGEL
ncbi:MAG: hydantoinase/oxoprolinase family protein [Halobacteriales archaeon]